MATTTQSLTDNHLVYFLAGALVPSLAWFFLRPKNDEFDPVAMEDDDDDEDTADATKGGPSSEWGYTDAPYKMVLCVNQELGMGKGKIAAQCCHAAVGCFKRAKKQCPKGVQAWERTGCAKIALKCPTQDEMEQIAIKAIERDIPCYIVEDAGRTQIAAGSRTVLGLGPAPTFVFEDVSNHLKLM
ncbi:Probable peptidyl-tRNA hydrolase 2 [Seminavis robusta]|uniref:peptidyl-tRNA hydrolase n=1 Tax=Seminavis robusta TaxID=568900 RepID=A0A9N8DIF2_9STRA|nr:Probable peptidyl-tRNA hydrolase 2 [Seminavis robusta]|eukprot:Sro80_g043130.1 Probable peptidyl-tRNA hydrolase 2 (185) ;mRNA; f:67183-67939